MTDNDNKLLGVVPKTRKNGKSAKKFKIVKVKGNTLTSSRLLKFIKLSKSFLKVKISNYIHLDSSFGTILKKHLK